MRLGKWRVIVSQRTEYFISGNVMKSYVMTARHLKQCVCAQDIGSDKDSGILNGVVNMTF